MLLLFDIGNSQTVAAVCDPANGDFRHVWRFPTDVILGAGGWRSAFTKKAREDDFDLKTISDVAITSVVPSITKMIATLVRDWLSVEPLVVNHTLQLGIELGVDFPEKVGTDRICNATAAYDCIGGAAIVVDVGTATKIEAISDGGVFLGGAIAPGIGVSLEALVSEAAQLDDVPLVLPAGPIGRNTIHAMQSGLVLGHLVMIEGMIKRFRDEMGTGAPAILTGGYSPLYWQQSNVFDRHQPDLTLRGLLLIWRLNRESTPKK